MSEKVLKPGSKIRKRHPVFALIIVGHCSNLQPATAFGTRAE